MKRGKPLARKTPIQRKTRLRAVGNTSYRRRARDFEFMRLVRKLPCTLHGLAHRTARDPLYVDFIHVTLCSGRLEADHAGERAKGRKSPDDTTIPLCHKHHHERTNYIGAFRDWTGPKMRAWCDLAIVYTRVLVSELKARMPT